MARLEARRKCGRECNCVYTHNYVRIRKYVYTSTNYDLSTSPSSAADSRTPLKPDCICSFRGRLVQNEHTNHKVKRRSHLGGFRFCHGGRSSGREQARGRSRQRGGQGDPRRAGWRGSSCCGRVCGSRGR
uniref:Uncharacterized protein n=1 Tax=Hyaloperonospora arabidopsidis (strain Emoy2) TaxID=559515 RepID=M4BK88_HYAAE